MWLGWRFLKCPACWSENEQCNNMCSRQQIGLPISKHHKTFEIAGGDSTISTDVSKHARKIWPTWWISFFSGMAAVRRSQRARPISKSTRNGSYESFQIRCGLKMKIVYCTKKLDILQKWEAFFWHHYCSHNAMLCKTLLVHTCLEPKLGLKYAHQFQLD